MPDPIEQRCVDTLRFLAVDAVQHADSGHPGMPLGAMPMAYVLWDRHLKHNPRNPAWTDRDRFVLSAGHGSMLLYALLYMTGYDLSLDDIKQFRQWGSRTPGHPERGHTPGVEVTTGPLGQGLGNAVGMAIAEAQLAARYNRPGHTIVDHRTWVIASDGDLMEGVAAEAAALVLRARPGHRQHVVAGAAEFHVGDVEFQRHRTGTGIRRRRDEAEAGAAAMEALFAVGALRRQEPAAAGHRGARRRQHHDVARHLRAEPRVVGHGERDGIDAGIAEHVLSAGGAGAMAFRHGASGAGTGVSPKPVGSVGVGAIPVGEMGAERGMLAGHHRTAGGDRPGLAAGAARAPPRTLRSTRRRRPAASLSVLAAGSSVRVARAASTRSLHPPRPLAPVGLGRSAHDDRRHHVRTDLFAQLRLKRPGHQPQLGGPRRRLGNENEHPVEKALRSAVVGDLRTDEAVPVGEHTGGSRGVLPAALRDQPPDQSPILHRDHPSNLSGWPRFRPSLWPRFQASSTPR